MEHPPRIGVNQSMLQADRLTKSYGGITAVRDVSFTLGGGQVLGYLGPNGSGKSTTIKMLTGLVEPTAGRVLFNGVSIADQMVEYRRVLGYIPEEPHVYSYFTGPEFLTLVRRLRGIALPVLARRIEELLDVWGLLDARHTPLASYSKGMRQKILISAALLHNPQVVIFDEPDAGLDVTAMLVLRAIVNKLAAEGRAVLYSSHVISTVETLSSDVVILHDGRIVAHDSSRRLRDLMSLPSLEDVFRRLAVHSDVDAMAARVLDIIAR
jgi:ABC-2 type transport system ATP-binding protein